MFIRNRSKALLATALCGSLVFLPIARQDQGVVLTNDSLKSMLDDMGYAPTALTKGYLVSIKRDTWTYNMQIVLSGDMSKVGINANLGSVPDPTTVTADQWRTLLEKSEDVDPSSFYYDKDQKKVYLHRALDNRAITPKYLREQIDNFTTNIHDTSDAWSFLK